MGRLVGGWGDTRDQNGGPGRDEGLERGGGGTDRGTLGVRMGEAQRGGDQNGGTGGGGTGRGCNAGSDTEGRGGAGDQRRGEGGRAAKRTGWERRGDAGQPPLPSGSPERHRDPAGPRRSGTRPPGTRTPPRCPPNAHLEKPRRRSEPRRCPAPLPDGRRLASQSDDVTRRGRRGDGATERR